MRLIIATILLWASAACAGTLYGYPYIAASIYDFSYQPAKSLPYSALSGPISLNATLGANSVNAHIRVFRAEAQRLGQPAA